VRRLLIRPGAIGDFIVSLPALEALRASYTEVWVASPNLPLVRFADQVRAIASTGLDMVEIPDREPPARLLEILRSFDSIISWYGAGRQAFRDAIRERHLPFRFFPALPRNADRHAVDFYLAQARAVEPDITAASAPRIACPRSDGGYAVVHPFASSAAKRWPLERFREVAAVLASHLPVAWCAGPEETLDGARSFDDLYELACWLASARLYVGNDSGIAHLAAAAGTPVVAVFGPTDPRIWAPRGPAVEVVSTPSPGPVEGVHSRDVLAAALHLLDPTGGE
jgi:ADP-heptose:LPS heptosyltransferase